MSNLTDNEKQEILRYVEAGKPLPEKFRFLLFEDKREIELVWNGKTHKTSHVVLPFQVIEQVDEPRAEKLSESNGQQSFNFDERGRQIQGWTNKLIWGDNKLVLSSLKNGPLRSEIEAQGGLKLIYIDPPFDVGADFSMDIKIGNDSFAKKPNILEELAYRDTWGKGSDSYIAMIYKRLALMRDLLAQNGSIYVHCDWRVSGYLRLALDEIFGSKNFINEIAWQKLTSAKTQSNFFSNIKDSIFLYSKTNEVVFNPQFIEGVKDDKNYPYIEEQSGRHYGSFDFTQSGQGLPKRFGDKLLNPPSSKHWIWSQEKIDAGMKDGKIIFTSSGTPRIKRYLDEKKGNYVGDLWTDNQVAPLSANSSERVNYPTQKPESLLERIISASSNKGDLVADFFSGSGTTASVAEKLGRKWIVSDLGKFAIHTTRKRMIEVQRQLKSANKEYRAFEILNLGRYERQHYVDVNADLREDRQQQQIDTKEAAFLNLILRAYSAEKVNGFTTFHGKRAGRMIVVGPVNLPVTRLFVEEVILESRKNRITKVDILGFEFEMGLFPNVLDEARNKGIDIAPKYIPTDVFDKRAVARNQVVFHDVAYIEVKPLVRGNEVAVELTDFSVFYSQDSTSGGSELRKRGSRIVVEKGQVTKLTRDVGGNLSREILTKYWTDWIDYWAVDFDFESKREIIRIQNSDTEKWEEQWTGDFVFENEWQSFRTNKSQTLDLTSIYIECAPGRHKIAVKVVDIFGNDTMKIVSVTVGNVT